MIKLLLLLLLLFPSCSFQKEESGSAESKALPSLVLKSAHYTLGQEGEHPLIIEGDTITLYEKEAKAIMENTLFFQRDEEGENLISGSAGKAEIDTKTKVAHFSGNVELKSEKNGYHISTAELTFDTEEEHISAEGSVDVTFPDGVIRCTGLEADLKGDTFHTGRIEEGALDK